MMNATLNDDALKPILQLAKDSADSNLATMRTVVLKALSDPRVFTGFDEIKTVLHPKLSSMGPDGDVLLRTLDLFSYGSHGDYNQAEKGSFLTLNDSQIFKLRQLTLLSIVHRCCGYGTGMTGNAKLPYVYLAKELGFVDSSTEGLNATLEDSVLRRVEMVVLESVYAHILAAQLCQQSQSLFITSRHGATCHPRDVPLANGAAMHRCLGLFYGHLEEAKGVQNHIGNHLRSHLLATRLHHKNVYDTAGRAKATTIVKSAPKQKVFGQSVGGMMFFGGGGGRGTLRGIAEPQVMGGPRNTKRSRVFHWN